MIDLRTLGTVTSGYGVTRTINGVTDVHTGIDIVLRDKNIPFVLGGTVEQVGYNASMGNFLKVKQTDGTTGVYMHMAKPATWKSGATVNEGETVGIMGTTGRSTGVHLHYEVRDANGNSINPVAFWGSVDSGTPIVDENGVASDDVIITQNVADNEYTLLGNIVRFLVIALIAVMAIYLILQAFDIKLL